MTRRMILACTLLAVLWGGPALAQPRAPSDSAHTHDSPAKAASKASDPDLAKQLEQLKAQVATLQAAMSKHQPGGQAAGAGGMGGMPMGKGGMGMGMGSMGGGMAMMDDMMSMGSGGMSMGCCPMMGKMPGGSMAGGMAMSALPGFPGASHLYHIGATGFFLDHPEHITLSPEQAATLGRAREDALRALGESARKVAAAEEQLWQLTAADQPSSASVEAKVREIEKLRGDDRLAFIRAVGEAAKVLTDEQRRALLGQLPPSPNPATGLGQAMPQPGGSMGGGMMMDDAMEMPPAGGSTGPGGGGGMGHM